MGKKRTIFSHASKDDFTESHVELVQYGEGADAHYWINIQEYFDADSDGNTESLASIDLTKEQLRALYRALATEFYFGYGAIEISDEEKPTDFSFVTYLSPEEIEIDERLNKLTRRFQQLFQERQED